MWQRPIEDFGQTGPDKQQGGKFLILGPGQVDPRETTGANAESKKYFVLRSPTFSVCFFFRSLDPDPAKGQQWIENLRFYSYDQRANPPASKILTPGGKPWSQTQPRGLAYWESLANIINKEPVIERDRVMMGMLKPVGIEKGKPFNPDARQKKLLEQAALVGEAMAKTITFAKRFDGARYRPDTRWAYGLLGNPEQESEFYTVAVARHRIGPVIAGPRSRSAAVIRVRVDLRWQRGSGEFSTFPVPCGR